MNSSRFRDGAKTYRLSVPQAVPQKLFWSITVYDAENPIPDCDRSGPGRVALAR
jgi:hypothetical protein